MERDKKKRSEFRRYVGPGATPVRSGWLGVWAVYQRNMSTAEHESIHGKGNRRT